ncbi:hypothetical protein O181_038928 [Austropuccinia psidii MF-1]|uniref:Uncharacterized protein n=1 Tax=Austropuccinia psidii MF-1 TaxID=1389203 RepID=A0A9Q3DEC8_9BASI|nr:hypothetical protein [Austropuccinia psidii MF-1]
MQSTIIQNSNKKIKDWKNKKREGKEEAQVASTRKPPDNQPPQEGKKNKKKNLGNPYYPGYRIPRIQKDAMENILNMSRTVMEFKAKEGRE